MNTIARLPKDAPYYFVRISTLDSCATKDCYFESDDERYNTANYFLSSDACRRCAASLRELYGETLRTINNAKLANKNNTIKAVQTAALSFKFEKAKEQEKDDLVEDARKVVEILKDYTDTVMALRKQQADTYDEIQEFITKYPKQ